MNDTYQQLAASAYRAMVDRFLSWKLPQDFGPDAGISFTPPPRLPDLYWPTGTNLFHAGQALEMFKHCVELPSAAAVRLAQKNLFDAQEAAKTITKQAIAAEAERDALAAKLAELEGQTDNLLSACHRLALELECLLLDTKDSASVSRWWDSAMAALDEWHKVKDSVSARPVPAEPVNARLLEALQGLLLFPNNPRENRKARAAIAAADARQERLLQDMHDAGLEIDRVMAEPAPEAVRLTDYSSTVDRAWARFCGAFGDGPDAPYPGMIASFEIHYGQSFRDKEWRTEASCWAAAWHKATELATKTNPQAKGD